MKLCACVQVISYSLGRGSPRPRLMPIGGAAQKVGSFQHVFRVSPLDEIASVFFYYLHPISQAELRWHRA